MIGETFEVETGRVIIECIGLVENQQPVDIGENRIIDEGVEYGYCLDFEMTLLKNCNIDTIVQLKSSHYKKRDHRVH